MAEATVGAGSMTDKKNIPKYEAKACKQPIDGRALRSLPCSPVRHLPSSHTKCSWS